MMTAIGNLCTFVLVIPSLFGKLNAQTGDGNETFQFVTFSSGPLTTNIGGGISLCESLICPQNDTVQFTEDRMCNCDGMCPLYEDCCYGFQRNGDAMSQLGGKQQLVMTCVATYLKYVAEFSSSWKWETSSGYFMVAQCLHEYKNKDVVEGCQLDDYNWLSSQHLTSWLDYGHHTPVTDTRRNISYKNVYCAWCNNVPIEAMEFWTLESDCSPDFPPTSCYTIRPTAPRRSTRSCVIIDVTSCPSDAPDKKVADLCHSGYYFPIFQNGTTYQNPHCVLCHEAFNSEGFNSTTWTFCEDGHLDDITEYHNVPQFLPFDFYSKASRDVNSTTIRCAYGFIFDATSNECIPAKPNTRISFPELCPSHFGYVYLFFFFNEEPLNKLGEIALQISKHYGLYEPSIIEIDCDRGVENAICLQLEVDTSPQVIEAIFSNTNGLYQSLNSKLALQKLFLLYACPGYYNSTTCEDEGVLPLSADHSDVFKFADMIVIRSQDQNRFFYNVTIAASATLSYIDGRKESDQNIHFCLKSEGFVELLCPHFTLNTNEYSLKMSNGEEYLFSEFLTKPLNQNNFLIAENDISHVCVLPGKDFRYLSIIYIVLSSFSLFFLFLALLTYCFFSFLRNGPGYLTMNFFVALFLSQLILLIGTNQTRNPVVCNVIAIAGHYTWLAAFLWTSVIALNVSRTFGTTLVSHRAKYSTKKLCVIMTSGWGIPALFVGICLFLQSSAVSFVNFTYGSLDGCWIKPGTVNFIIFGIPASSCLLFNLVMFLWAIWGIRKAMERSRKVQTSKTSTELFKDEIFLYIKVSILMGFCWIWAFLTGFFPEVFAFLVLNTFISPLQGFLVFCIYVCNKRMTSTWRTKMSGIFSSEGNISKLTVLSSSDVTKSGTERKTGN